MTSRDTERLGHLVNNIPLSLRYFQTVDTFMEGRSPEFGCLCLDVYYGGKMPLSVFRIPIENPEGTALRDEIILGDIIDGDKLKLNGKRNQEGIYYEYSDPLTDQENRFLQRTFDQFELLAHQEGSIIRINRQPIFRSSQGIWINQLTKKPVADIHRFSSPTLPHPNTQ